MRARVCVRARVRVFHEDFPGGTVVKTLPANAGDTEDTCSKPGLGRLPGGGNGKTTPIFLPGEFRG